MKKILFFILILSIGYKADAQITVLSNGNVGIGPTIPTFNLQVCGTLGAGATTWGNWHSAFLDWPSVSYYNPTLFPDVDGGLFIGKPDKRSYIYAIQVWSKYFTTFDSDEKLKENIKSMGSTLSLLSQVQAKKYHFKTTEKESFNLPTNQKRTFYGFIAQDLEKVFPDLVYAPDSVHPTYAVDYIGLIPVLVEAIKEQQTQIENLEKQLKANSNLKSGKISSSADVLSSTDLPTLSQNAPNPFNQTTRIDYYLPEIVQKAQFFVYDMNGVQLKSYPVDQKGNGNIAITASEFRPGMYLYTLIADGKEVNTKRMILTE